MLPEEIDAEIVRYRAALDQIRSVVRDNYPNDLRTEVTNELIDLADRMLHAWALDRAGNL